MAFSIADARQCMALSDLAYENNAAVLRDWLARRGAILRDRLDEKVPITVLKNGPKTDTQAFFAEDDRRCYIAFRGSELKFEDWITDFSIDTDKEAAAGGDELHQGFYKGLTGPIAAAKIAKWVAAANGKPILVTGHSLGGALAAMLTVISPKPFEACYTFGQPRIGRITKPVKTPVYRVVNRADVVPRVPVDFERFMEDSVPGFLRPVVDGLLKKLAKTPLVKANDFTHTGLGIANVFRENGKLVENGEDAYLRFLADSAADEALALLRAIVKGKSFRYSGSLISDHGRANYLKALRDLK
jgi:fermentation-respiration switch protein FrsA (DUF1100 family)